MRSRLMTIDWLPCNPHCSVLTLARYSLPFAPLPFAPLPLQYAMRYIHAFQYGLDGDPGSQFKAMPAASILSKTLYCVALHAVFVSSFKD